MINRASTSAVKRWSSSTDTWSASHDAESMRSSADQDAVAIDVAGGSGADFLFQANAGGYIFGLSSGSAGLVWNLASGGYIIGFIPAAFVVGYLCERGWDRRVWILLAMGAGNIVLYIPGLIQLSLFVPNDKVLEFGLYPFIFGDLAKLYVASLSVPSAWALAGRLGGKPGD